MPSRGGIGRCRCSHVYAGGREAREGKRSASAARSSRPPPASLPTWSICIPRGCAQVLRDQGIEAATVTEIGMAGRSDADIFAAATDGGYALLTENVSDFARLGSEHVAAGRHHFGLLVALSSGFSRRPTPPVMGVSMPPTHASGWGPLSACYWRR